jgi:hypothetical protein
LASALCLLLRLQRRVQRDGGAGGCLERFRVTILAQLKAPPAPKVEPITRRVVIYAYRPVGAAE